MSYANHRLAEQPAIRSTPVLADLDEAFLVVVEIITRLREYEIVGNRPDQLGNLCLRCRISADGYWRG